jgi:hypothetical protein
MLALELPAEEIPLPTSRNTILNFLGTHIRKRSQYFATVPKTGRHLQQEKYNKHPLENTKIPIKSGFKWHTSYISINNAVDDSFPIYHQVTNNPPLVPDKVLRQGANLFEHDRSRLINPLDALEFFDIFPDAAYFMQDTENEKTQNDIESSLHSCSAEKAP